MDRRGRLLKLLVTAGQCGDAPQAERLLEELQPGTVRHVIADAAYDSNAILQRETKTTNFSISYPACQPGYLMLCDN